MESFPSLTITIFPSFKIKKTNETIQRTFIFHIVMQLKNKNILKKFRCKMSVNY